MRRASLARAVPGLLAALLLAACGSAPKPVEPPLRKQALETETDAAKRYARGDYAGASRRFGDAGRLQRALDDTPASERNLLNQARAELALGRAEAALARVAGISSPELAVAALLVNAQANLALDRLAPAQASLTAAADACPANCPQAASLHLLEARVALAERRPQDALAHAEAALPVLSKQDEARETANAWRLVAAARLATGDGAAALNAARTALDIDRKLGLPEKIARDWLLIGDIGRRGGTDDPRPAYQRALDVARAAGLGDVAATATQALKDMGGERDTTR